MTMQHYQPEGQLLHTAENQRLCAGLAELREAFYSETVLEGRVIRCDAQHHLHVALGSGIEGLIPREEGAVGIAEGTVRDIALISRVNKPVMFVITGFTQTETGAPRVLLSRRRVQEACLRDDISKLRPGDVIPATVTHLEPFGAFCDIGAGISALLPIDSISVSRIPHPAARFAPGQKIFAAVRQLEAGRITLTHKELLGTWEQNAAQLQVGETVPGLVRSVEPYGIFVELAPNLAGLAESAEQVRAGDHAAVYIKSMLPHKMKIKLIIVDAFAASYPPAPPQYFITEGHLDRWRYSPPDCARIVESIF